MADFAVGTWNMVDTKNFDEYMKAVGKKTLLSKLWLEVYFCAHAGICHT